MEVEFVVGDGIGKLKPQDVIFVKAIALKFDVLREENYLKSVDDEGSLECVFEISKTENHFFTRALLARDQSNRLEARERAEDV